MGSAKIKVGFEIETIQTLFDIECPSQKIFIIEIGTPGSVIFVKIQIIIKKAFELFEFVMIILFHNPKPAIRFFGFYLVNGIVKNTFGSELRFDFS